MRRERDGAALVTSIPRRATAVGATRMASGGVPVVAQAAPARAGASRSAAAAIRAGRRDSIRGRGCQAGESQ
ncbi:hypothetical protein [Streptomyces chartreusis]